MRCISGAAQCTYSQADVTAHRIASAKTRSDMTLIHGLFNVIAENEPPSTRIDATDTHFRQKALIRFGRPRQTHAAVNQGMLSAAAVSRIPRGPSFAHMNHPHDDRRQSARSPSPNCQSNSAGPTLGRNRPHPNTFRADRSLTQPRRIAPLTADRHPLLHRRSGLHPAHGMIAILSTRDAALTSAVFTSVGLFFFNQLSML